MMKKKDFGRKILELMAKAGIKTTKELTDKINEIAGQRQDQRISASSVGKWLSGESEPKSTSLMFLAKALNVSADLILYDEGDNPESKKSLERIVSSIVKEEIKKIPKKDGQTTAEELNVFLNSEEIPKDVRESILEMIRSLKRKYTNRSNDSDSIK